MNDFIEIDYKGLQIPLTKDLQESLKNRSELLGINMHDFVAKIVIDSDSDKYLMLPSVPDNISVLLAIYAFCFHSDVFVSRELSQIVRRENYEVCIDEHDKELFLHQYNGDVQIPVSYNLLASLEHGGSITGMGVDGYIKRIIEDLESQKFLKLSAVPVGISMLLAIYNYFLLDYKAVIRALSNMAEDECCVLPSFIYCNYKKLI